jgi:hypothetical protein
MYVCMYVFMYVCIYVWIYVCMCVCMYLCMYICMHACMCVFIYLCMYVYMYLCMYVCIYLFIYLCIYVCTYVYLSIPVKVALRVTDCSLTPMLYMSPWGRYRYGIYFSSFKFVHAVLRLTQPSIQWVPNFSPQRVKLPGREVCNSRPSNAEVRNEWSYTSTPPIHHYGVYKDSLPFAFTLRTVLHRDTMDVQNKQELLTVFWWVFHFEYWHQEYTFHIHTQAQWSVYVPRSVSCLSSLLHVFCVIVTKTAIVFLGRTNRLVFVTKKQCVFSKVRMKCLCIARLCTAWSWTRTVETSVISYSKAQSTFPSSGLSAPRLCSLVSCCQEGERDGSWHWAPVGLHRVVILAVVELVLLHWGKCVLQVGGDGKCDVVLCRRKELTRGWSILDADELHGLTAHSDYLGDQTKENETDGTCGQCGGDEKCTRCFGGEKWRKQVTGDTSAEMGLDVS